MGIVSTWYHVDDGLPVTEAGAVGRDAHVDAGVRERDVVHGELVQIRAVVRLVRGVARVQQLIAPSVKLFTGNVAQKMRSIFVAHAHEKCRESR